MALHSCSHHTRVCRVPGQLCTDLSPETNEHQQERPGPCFASRSPSWGRQKLPNSHGRQISQSPKHHGSLMPGRGRSKLRVRPKSSLTTQGAALQANKEEMNRCVEGQSTAIQPFLGHSGLRQKLLCSFHQSWASRWLKPPSQLPYRKPKQRTTHGLLDLSLWVKPFRSCTAGKQSVRSSAEPERYPASGSQLGFQTRGRLTHFQRTNRRNTAWS